jgi:hypothetical protein
MVLAQGREIASGQETRTHDLIDPFASVGWLMTTRTWRPDLRIHAVFAPRHVTYCVLASAVVPPLSVVPHHAAQHGAANRISVTPLRDHAIDHSP